jgi:adenosylcobyric acid synthase
VTVRQHRPPALAVWGTSSWAGKSVLATALCASLHRRGIRVVPFKAQNMSNNARVADGGEIGAAQYFQALAAGVAPAVEHNPVLLKPEAATRSQVVVLGQVDRALTEMPWRERAPHLWAIIRDTYDRLAKEADVVVIEGAGSPAEVNLADVDLANLGISRHAGASALLVSDIDRGGAFAHLYGTWALLEEADRRRIAGFVLNRFRGDPALLEPGPAALERLTGTPMLGVVPMVDHGLPDEDGADPAPGRGTGRRVRIVRGPAASNLDEWWALRESSDCRWATSPSEMRDAELIVMPGSKLPVADLAWLRATGLDEALLAAHRRGVPILAVCGGAQLLGEEIIDPDRVEMGGRHAGLGLISAVTTFASTKQVHRTRARFREDLPPPWSSLAGLEVDGYEVHFGTTRGRSGLHPAFTDGSGMIAGPVLAVYVHGLCEDPRVLKALVGAEQPRSLGPVFEGLADLVDRYLDMESVMGLVERSART